MQLIDKYDVVVILINFNNSNDTIDCVTSINKYSLVKPFVIIVDNASTENVDLRKSLAFYPHLELLKTKTNIGFGRANNLGINWARNNIVSKYIFILNNDTLIGNDVISQLRTSFDKCKSNVAMISPKIVVESNRNEVWYCGGTLNLKKVTPNLFQPGSKILKRTKSTFASGCAMFFKAEVLFKLGGFDPFFFMYDEDVDLSIRLKENNYEIINFNDIIIYHKCQGSQTKEKSVPLNQLSPFHPSLHFYLSNTIVNRRYIINKHLYGTKKLNSLIFHSLYWILKAAQFFLYRNYRASLITFKALFYNYSKITEFHPTFIK